MKVIIGGIVAAGVGAGLFLGAPTAAADETVEPVAAVSAETPKPKGVPNILPSHPLNILGTGFAIDFGGGRGFAIGGESFLGFGDGVYASAAPGNIAIAFTLFGGFHQAHAVAEGPGTGNTVVAFSLFAPAYATTTGPASNNTVVAVGTMHNPARATASGEAHGNTLIAVDSTVEAKATPKTSVRKASTSPHTVSLSNCNTRVSAQAARVTTTKGAC